MKRESTIRGRASGRLTAVAMLGLAAITATGCTSTGDIVYNGFVADEQTLALAPVGSSREQVLLSLGTPSSTATFDNEVFYYISQKRKRSVDFMKLKVVEQSVLSYYFDKDGNVERIGNYTLKDGKVFDMISRTTPTGGKDLSFLQQLLAGGRGSAKNAVGNAIFGTSGGNF